MQRFDSRDRAVVFGVVHRADDGLFRITPVTHQNVHHEGHDFQQARAQVPLVCGFEHGKCPAEHVAHALLDEPPNRSVVGRELFAAWPLPRLAFQFGRSIDLRFQPPLRRRHSVTGRPVDRRIVFQDANGSGASAHFRPEYRICTAQPRSPPCARIWPQACRQWAGATSVWSTRSRIASNRSPDDCGGDLIFSGDLTVECCELLRQAIQCAMSVVPTAPILRMSPEAARICRCCQRREHGKGTSPGGLRDAQNDCGRTEGRGGDQEESADLDSPVETTFWRRARRADFDHPGHGRWGATGCLVGPSGSVSVRRMCAPCVHLEKPGFSEKAGLHWLRPQGALRQYRPPVLPRART